MKICLAGPEEFTPKVEMIKYLEACGLPIDFEHQTDPYIAREFGCFVHRCMG